MKPFEEWNAVSTVAAGACVGAVFNVLLYISEWGLAGEEIDHIALFVGVGTFLGGVVFFAMWIIRKANRR